MKHKRKRKSQKQAIRDLNKEITRLQHKIEGLTAERENAYAEGVRHVRAALLRAFEFFEATAGLPSPWSRPTQGRPQ